MMTRKTIDILFCLLAFCLTTACTNDPDVEPMDATHATFALQLSASLQPQTRGEYTPEAIEGVNNENLLQSAFIYFYANSNVDGNAVCRFTWNGTAQKVQTVTGSLTQEAIDILFPTGTTTCTAYVIVNAPAGTVLPDVATGTDTKMATLKAISVNADFTGTPSSFVMDGTASITFNTTTEIVSGTVSLDRAASKVALFVKPPQDYTDDAGNLWKAQISDYPMTVRFYNGVKSSCINTDGGNNTAITRDSYFNIAGDNSRDVNVAVEENEQEFYTHTLPFYSYSSDWGRLTLPDNEAYMLLCIYWRKVEDKHGNAISETDSPAEAYYYRVPINLNGAKDGSGNITHTPLMLARNTYYKATIEVGVLGDKDLNSEILLTPTYIMLPWKTENIDATMSELHYLAASPNHIELFNETTATFSFTACEEVVDAKIISITRPDFSATTVGTTTFYQNNTGTTQVTNNLLKPFNLTTEGNTVTLTHELVNDISNSAGFDFAPYTIIVRLTTDCGLTTDVEIKQYPANSIDGVDTRLTSRLPGKNSSGTVFINNNADGSGNNSNPQWDYVKNEDLDLNSSSNSNPNSYLITVSSFSAEDLEKYPYIIGDPRDRSANGGQGYSAAELLQVLGVNNQTISADSKGNTLQHYYPTLGSTIDYNTLRPNDEDSPYHQWQYLIAPQFRVVTAYASMDGGSLSSNKDYAVLRCASYQEYGRPAGRWRVPTPAELTYILTLIEEDVINPIIYNGGSYFSSFGRPTFSNTGDAFQNGANSVRCVYDEWYWGDDNCEVGEFTWGDEIIN